MLGIRTLVDIGFFLSIIGFVVYPFVNEAVRRDSRPDAAAPDVSPPFAETFDVELVDPETRSKGQTKATELPTLTIDATGRDVRAVYLDDSQVAVADLGGEIRKRGIRRLRIKGHPDAANQVVMDAKRLCAQGGVTSFADTRDPTTPALAE